MEHDSSPGWADFDAPHNTTVLHIRGGYIIPMQGSANNTVFRLAFMCEILILGNNKYSLVINEGCHSAR
jgi:alpha-glucosidase (family GH31 glycosyl hydrolase)